jgi:ABC-2 type transport system permease protein
MTAVATPEPAAGSAEAGRRPASRVASVSLSLAMRSIVGIRRMPSAFIPSLVMPIFLTLAFSGAFAAVTQLPGFPADDSLNWFVPLAALQGAAFGGLGVSFGAIRDLENGFQDRLLMSPSPRVALLAGPLLAGVIRALIPVVLVCAVGSLGGMRLPGGWLGFLMLGVAAMGVGLAAGGWGMGLAYRIKNMGAAALMQVGIFFVIFLSTAQVPLTVMSGWLHAVARVNPMTNVLRMARQGFLGPVTWDDTWPGLLALAGFCAVTVVFAVRGLRKLVP